MLYVSPGDLLKMPTLKKQNIENDYYYTREDVKEEQFTPYYNEFVETLNKVMARMEVLEREAMLGLTKLDEDLENLEIPRTVLIKESATMLSKLHSKLRILENMCATLRMGVRAISITLDKLEALKPNVNDKNK